MFARKLVDSVIIETFGLFVFFFHFHEKGSTLNYYTGLPVHVMNTGFGVLWYGLQDRGAPKLGLDENELTAEWTSGKRIFLFSERGPLKSFLERHPDFHYRLLAHDGGKKVIVNW